MNFGIFCAVAAVITSGGDQGVLCGVIASAGLDGGVSFGYKQSQLSLCWHVNDVILPVVWISASSG
jgi:hypothetical protein